MRETRLSYPIPPAPFLTTILHDLSVNPPIAALCAGYEAGVWRASAFAEHVMEWLPEFSLTAEELKTFTPGTAMRLVKKAARLVYQTPKYGKRGEFGEMFLHIAIRQLYGSIPAISKIFWKDSVNSTVKGFDAVHVVDRGNSLELWLGEVKFYEDGHRAIADVAAEIVEHTKTDYLRNEFMLIANKLDPLSPHHEKLKKLLDPNTSLDEVFDAACIPILITYESDAVKGHGRSDPAYRASLEAELAALQKKFDAKIPAHSLPIKLHLFILPIHTKKILIQMLDDLLKGYQ